MILQRLAEFAERVPGKLPPMFSNLHFKWQIELNEDGEFRGFTPLGDANPKSSGLLLAVPNVKRTGLKPLLLADNAKYVLGLGSDGNALPSESQHFAAFLERTRQCADAVHERAVQLVLHFLEDHMDSPVGIPEGMQPGDNVCFRVGSLRPTDLPSVARFWLQVNAPEGDRMQCILCGKHGPVDRISPVAIKGLARIGGQSAGMAVVSANKESFLSYGAKQSLISPTCRSCGEAYGNALNYLIESESHRVFVGPAVFVFWTREESPFSPATLLSQPSEEDVKALILSYRSGRPMTEADPDAFCSLSISASASRVAIRDWLETTVPAAQANLGRWFALQKIVDLDGSEGRYYGVYALSASLYLKPNDQMVANVPRTMVRCALHGGPMPESLLNQAVNRNRAEQGVTRNRAALIKAVMLSQLRSFKEDYMERLELSITSPGYLCGRLLAELEAAQKAAINPGATLVNRYYGAASSAPATVFGHLLRDFQVAHMSKLRKTKPGVYAAIDVRVQEILGALGEFPRVLTLKEQALFSLGYYHQKAANRADMIARAEVNTKTNEAMEEQEDATE